MRAEAPRDRVVEDSAGSSEPTRLGTRWTLATPMIVIGFCLTGLLLSLVWTNVLASSLVYQGTPAKFSTSRVSGENVAFGVTDMSYKNGDGSTGTRKVLRAGFATSRLNGFCLSQIQSLPGIGNVTVKISAGDGNASTREIEAVNVQFDVQQLRGNGTGVNMDGVVQIGLGAADVTTLPGVDNPFDAQLGIGHFGIDAAAGDIYLVKGLLHNAEIGGPLSLPGLKITAVPGGSECYTSLTTTDDLPN